METVAESLGELQRTFRPKMANIIAGAIIGIGLIVGGIAFTLFFTRRPDPRPLSTGDRIAKYALIGLIGAGAPLGGRCPAKLGRTAC